MANCAACRLRGHMRRIHFYGHLSCNITVSNYFSIGDLAEDFPNPLTECSSIRSKGQFGDRVANIKDGAFVIALAIEGVMLDSVELSNKIEALGVGGVSQIVFVIGGSLGLSKAVLSRLVLD